MNKVGKTDKNAFLVSIFLRKKKEVSKLTFDWEKGQKFVSNKGAYVSYYI